MVNLLAALSAIPYFNVEFFGISIAQYVFSLLLFLFIMIVTKVVVAFIMVRLRAFSKRTKNTKDDVLYMILQRLGWFFFMSVGLFFALLRLPFPSVVDVWLGYVFYAILTYYGVRVVFVLVNYGFARRVKEQDRGFLDIWIKILKGIIWAMAVLLLLSNMGLNVTSFIATLGVGGIAIALALQSVLSDVFASVSIHFDKPFELGHFIIVGEHMGVVKKIGIKSTRIESLWGEEIVISNQELTSTRIQNYKFMERRRIHFQFGVTYDTPVPKLKRIKEAVKSIFEGVELADLDRVHFKSFADSSLLFEVAYYINSADYNQYMDVQEMVNWKLMEELSKLHVEFAFPTRTVYVKK